MKKNKRILGILVFILVLNLLIFSVACKSNDILDDEPPTDNGITTVELTMENYQNYLTVTHTTINYHKMESKGCLTFAIYENVVIILSHGEVMNLNAAGEGSVRIEYDSYVVSVTGTVKYRL